MSEMAAQRQQAQSWASALMLASVAASSVVVVSGAGPVQGLWGAWPLAEGVLLLMLTASVVRHAPRERAVLGGVLGPAALLALPLRILVGANASGIEWAFFEIAAVLAAAGATGWGALRRSRDASRVRREAEIRRGERIALAGELHDVIAQDLTGMVLEAQASRAEGETIGPETLDRIERAGLSALTSMDRTVAMLRSADGFPARVAHVDELDELLDRFEATGRVTVRRNFEVSPAALRGSIGDEVGDTVYRVVDEALTNVRRHAAGTRMVQVGLRYAAEAVQVRVTDDGGRAAMCRSTGGSGLLAITARVEALGGTVQAGRHGPGWRVQAQLPAWEEA